MKTLTHAELLRWALDYIDRLEKATGWMYASRSYMKHPATDSDRKAYLSARTQLNKKGREPDGNT